MCKSSYSLILKLITAAATILVLFSIYLTIQQGNYIVVKQTTVQTFNCRQRERNIQDKLKQQERRHVDKLSVLQGDIQRLKQQLNITTDLERNLTDRLSNCQRSAADKQARNVENGVASRRVIESLSRHSNEGRGSVVSESELLKKGQPRTHFRHEYEAILWESFTARHVYHVEDQLSPLPVETLGGRRGQELSDVFDYAVKLLTNETKRSFSVESDLLEGYSQCDKTKGIFYDLYFRRFPEEKGVAFVRHLRLFRPFTPIQLVAMGQSRLVTHGNKMINLILPLHGRLPQFHSFLRIFSAYCINDNARVFLTVVYFGEKGREEAKNGLERMAKSAHYTNYKFLSIKDGNFSRMRGMIYGVETWDGGNDIMLFFDVDIMISVSFLERCRMNTSPGGRVYFPIVFSLYDPKVVYADKTRPLLLGQLLAKVHTGTWRVHGYGIACQYRNDFLAVSKMEPFGETWGKEGIELFWRYRWMGLRTTRAFDRGIFHWYHERYCDAGRPVVEYEECLVTKARYTMSHRQMGVLVAKTMVGNRNVTV